MRLITPWQSVVPSSVRVQTLVAPLTTCVNVVTARSLLPDELQPARSPAPKTTRYEATRRSTRGSLSRECRAARTRERKRQPAEHHKVSVEADAGDAAH